MHCESAAATCMCREFCTGSIRKLWINVSTLIGVGAAAPCDSLDQIPLLAASSMCCAPPVSSLFEEPAEKWRPKESTFLWPERKVPSSPLRQRKVLSGYWIEIACVE
jgi:hypothetical protein